MSDGTLTSTPTPIIPLNLSSAFLADRSVGCLTKISAELLEALVGRTGCTQAAMIRLMRGTDVSKGRALAAVDPSGTRVDLSTIPGFVASARTVDIEDDGIGVMIGDGSSQVAFSCDLGGDYHAVVLLDFVSSADPFQRLTRSELAGQLQHACPLLACANRVEELEGESSATTPEPAGEVTSEFPHFGGEVIYYQNMVSRSAKMAELFDQIDRVRNNKLSTIITGDTGTGKELVARAIHFAGNRANAPFEVVACGSVPNTLLESELFGHRKGAFSGAENDQVGVFERGSGGTVFLDEIADMSMEMQQKILRVLQEERVRPVGATESLPIDVRIVSSSRHDVMELVQAGKFREDLYYRLNVMTLEVPPLRDRREDIPLLIDHFLCNLNDEEDTQKRVADSAMRELLQYGWPGNVQELRNVLTRAFLSTTGRTISKKCVAPLLNREVTNSFMSDDLCQEGERLHMRIPLRQGFNEIVAECEKLIIIHALKANRGNKSRVTQQLGIPRQTLYNKLEKYGITEEDYATE